MKFSCFCVVFHPSARLVPAFRFDYPNEMMSQQRYAIFLKFSETLPMTHVHMDVTFPTLEPFNSMLT